MSVARYFATKSEAKKKHGAIIVKGGRVLGTGYNKNTNNPNIVSPEHIKTSCSRHAEIEAIRDSGGSVRNAVLYVARVNNRGDDRDSKPCILCQKAIQSHGIKRVIYTETRSK